MPSSQTSALMPGEYSLVVSGTYMNQPPSGAMPKKIELNASVPPKR